MPVWMLEESETFKHRNDGIYPDNLTTVLVFIDMKTQWRVGPGGPIGLDYGVLREIWSTRRIKLADRAEILDGLQVMEEAVLKMERN